MPKGGKKSDSEKIIIEISIEDDTITIVPQGGGVYIYERDEVDQNKIDQLLPHADITVYSQNERYTVEEMEDLGIGIWGAGKHEITPDEYQFRWY